MKALCFAVTIAIALGAAAASHAQQPAPTSPEQNAIEETAHAFVKAYDAGDAAAVAALWIPGGQYTVGQVSVKGREAIQKLYEEFFSAHPGSKMQIKIDSVNVVAPGVAVEQGTASVSGSPNGLPSASNYVAVHVKQNGKWQMASVWDSDTPVPLPEADLQELDWLVGEWSAQGEDAKVDVKYDFVADNHYLRGETTVQATDAAATPGGMQIIGKDPLTGQIVTWFFHADGGRGYGQWTKDGDRWLIRTEGATADGHITNAVNVLYQPHEDVMSWQSLHRTIGGHSLPDTKEIVIERVAAEKPAAK